MPPKKKTGGKRGRPAKKSDEGEKPAVTHYTTRKDAYMATRANFQLVKNLSARLPGPGEDEGLNAIETLFANFSSKVPSALSYDLIEQCLPGFWSDRQVKLIEVDAADLRGGAEGATKIADVFLKVLEKGYAGKKEHQMSLESFNSSAQWSEAILKAVRKAVDEGAVAGSQHFPSPDRSREGSPPVQSSSELKAGDLYGMGNSSEDDVDQLEPDGDDLPSAAQAKSAAKQKEIPVQSKSTKAAVKVPAPKPVAEKKTTSKGRSGRRTRSKGTSDDDDDGDEQPPARRRSGRMPAPTQAPREAAKSRPRHPAESIVSVKIDGILWPAAITEDEPEEVSDAEGELSPGCYVVQLIPSHARHFVSASDVGALPAKKKRAIPDSLKGSKRADYEKALELLEDGQKVALDRWLNGAASDKEEEQESSDAEDEEEPKSKKARVGE